MKQSRFSLQDDLKFNPEDFTMHSPTHSTTAIQLSFLFLFLALFCQGCIPTISKQPVYYPPPEPVPVPEIIKQPHPEIKPITQRPKKSNVVATAFSRQAAKQSSIGRTDLAAATLERGLRVAPKDAGLWSQLAAVKLKQKKYQQASSLARKSNSLAGNNTKLIQKNLRIIDQVRKITTDLKL